MKSRKKHPETFEEIVFRNRNKAYGAFLLRTTYARTVAISVIVTLFVFSFAVSWAMWSTRSKGPLMGPDHSIPVDSTIIINHDPPPDVPPETLPPANEKPLLKPVVVDSAVETSLPTQGELEGNANQGITETTGKGTADSIVVKDEPMIIPEPSEPLVIVSEMPEFPGGDAERVKYLKNNLTYPAEARELGIVGTVYLEFIVEPDGSLSHVKILRGIGGNCEEEAVRVVQMMPKWKPGRQQGHEVRVRLTMPIKFTLQ